MSTRAAPGPQLSSGRLRVDAARAIAKLREYQLVDRTAWVLEAVRAAVASGGTAISLTGDANDVWLAWEGEPWAADDLPRLFDELVSPEPLEERHHLRLLAAAVNSALGIDPAFVDLYSVSAEGTLRARYTPEVLIETADIEDSALRKVAAEPAEPPPGIAYATGMIVHLRRRAALGMVTYLFWHREPPELVTARAACRDLAVPITIGRETFSRDRGSDLARIAFDGDLDGFVALCDPAMLPPGQREAVLEIAERGVVLARYPLSLDAWGGAAPRWPVPLRVFVDAKRMPTNASRSQVRREVPPISTTEQRTPAIVDTLIEALAKEVDEAECDPRKRHAALSLIASIISGPDWSTRLFAERLGPLAKAAVLRDATGTPRKAWHAWSGHVYTGKQPLEPELGPWVSSILWIPRGDPAAALVAGATLDARDTKRRLRWAKAQRASHRRFFAHAPRDASLTLASPPRLRLKLGAKLDGGCVPASWFENLSGELAIMRDRRDGEVLVLFQGRPIERVVLPSPIGFEAIIDAVHLTPGDRYKSVTRDAYFTIVERALQAALICAAEVMAVRLDGGSCELPDGITDSVASERDIEARTIRAAMGMTRDLELMRSALLSKAKVWPTAAGEWVDFHALAAERVIGTTVSGNVPRLERLVVVGGQVLGKLLPNTRLVDYDQRRGSVSPDQVPRHLAQKLALEHAFALAIHDDGELRGAIAPTRTRSLLHLHHLGNPLDRCELRGSLGGCTVAVDSDAIAPDVHWRMAADSAGVNLRNFRDWEIALLRATLRALAGDRPAELLGPPIVGLDGALVQWAFGVLHASPSPHAIDPTLDEALFKRVKAAPLIHVLGERALISIDELAKRFPTTLFYVDAQSAPVAGFAPMVASAEVAEVIGRLAGIAIADGQAELATQRRLAERNARLEKHRLQPELRLAFPLHEPEVELVTTEGLAVRGFVGVGRNRLELEVRVENRPFITLIRSESLPLYAVVDLDLAHVDDQFTGLEERVIGKLLEGVQRMLPALFAKIANDKPTALAEPGFPRTLLYKWLANATLVTLPKLRAALCAAPAFTTIHGTRSSITDATQPSMILHTSAWSGEWMGVADGEPPSAFEEGVLLLLEDDHQLSTIIDKLHPGKVVDVTDEVSKLQANRRMARGLIPIPALPHVPAELKRKLSQLGELGVRLGHGELGLVADSPSVLIHDHGALRQRFEIDVMPAVQLAIEAPELLDDQAEPQRGLDLAGNVADQLARLRELSSRPARAASLQITSDAQQLAHRLLRDVLASGGELPVGVKRSIRRGLLAKRIPPSLVGELPLFERTDGAWVPLAALDQQIARFGNAWVVTSPTQLTPFDEARAVFVMTPDELVAAARNYAVVDAALELDLDQQARRNRARPPVGSLEIVGRGHFLAQVTMEGDGTTNARGIVAPLLPHSVRDRGVLAHRGMVPFSRMDDPCRWPTLAMIDDARLEPDRTWDRPRATAAWTDVSARISSISERALVSLVPRPEGAIAHIHVGPGVSLGPEVMSAKLQIRGGVWLTGAPRTTQLEVCDKFGHHLHTPLQALGIGGTLYVFAPDGWNRDDLLEDLIPRLYGHLVSQLLGAHKLTTKPPSDVVAAHAATALALKAISPADAGAMLFGSIRPEPLDAKGLVRMFESHEPVSILPLGELEAELIAADAEGVVEDGSELSQALIARLAARATRERKRRAPSLPPIPPPQIGLPTPRVEVPPPPKPEVVHPIQNVVDAVRARLIDQVAPQFDVRILDTTSPIIGFARALTFAGRDPRLHAISNALRANSPWAPLAIEALCAHAITVLDDAYSQVNQQTVRDVLADLLR